MWCSYCKSETEFIGTAAEPQCARCGRRITRRTTSDQAVRHARDIIARWANSDIFDQISALPEIPPIPSPHYSNVATPEPKSHKSPADTASTPPPALDDSEAADVSAGAAESPTPQTETQPTGSNDQPTEPSRSAEVVTSQAADHSPEESPQPAARQIVDSTEATALLTEAEDKNGGAFTPIHATEESAPLISIPVAHSDGHVMHGPFLERLRRNQSPSRPEITDTEISSAASDPAPVDDVDESPLIASTELTDQSTQSVSGELLFPDATVPADAEASQNVKAESSDSAVIDAKPEKTVSVQETNELWASIDGLPSIEEITQQQMTTIWGESQSVVSAGEASDQRRPAAAGKETKVGSSRGSSTAGHEQRSTDSGDDVTALTPSPSDPSSRKFRSRQRSIGRPPISRQNQPRIQLPRERKSAAAAKGQGHVNRKLRVDNPGGHQDPERSEATESVTSSGQRIQSNASPGGQRFRFDAGQPVSETIQTADHRSRTQNHPHQRYIDEGHGLNLRGPHFQVTSPRRSNLTSATGQFLAYVGVLGLTVGTAMVIYGHFGGYSEYTPTGWLVTTVAQMMLFLGVINLVSGGIEQNNDDVSQRINSLGEQLMRIEQVTEQALRGPRIPAHRYVEGGNQVESERETVTVTRGE
ncbi:MAG: hypothetical protein KDA81_01080 [Planctomycetaceae bacterium]|nr:hypothetical protein [Planctomycetaceae bacterium]